MSELDLGYANHLAEQILLICSLLGGFSITIVANLLVSLKNSKLYNSILAMSVLAAGFFLTAVFSMTKLLLMTTKGYPRKLIKDDLISVRIVGSTSFLIGIIALLTVISLAGWTKSKKLGYFTTCIGAVTLVLVFYSM
ncbi:hypothetical protein NBT05_14725 [Aquimarina sp. ERC-38]|uniref:hypothetical protein n=1 Tax=Aquimarina sp. ERC-38 TaxID=2949996 RepID=UPI002247C69B|nr:hypothetical protein [Aquimarina sp. ERC-38]UZO80196.1 hypothetical protein NBT05_14725 [Aquimarina sp. ERC-38]